MIEVEYEGDSGLTVVSIVGSTTFDEVMSVIKAHYPSVGCGLMWDITRGSMGALTSDNLRRISKTVRELRRSGFTAYVGSEDLEYGLLRMYETISEFGQARHELGVFRTVAEARAWLADRQAGSAPPPPPQASE